MFFPARQTILPALIIIDSYFWDVDLARPGEPLVLSLFLSVSDVSCKESK